MKVIKSENAPQSLGEILNKLQQEEPRIILWQISPQNGERHVTEGILKSCDRKENTVFLKINSPKITKSLPLYCYSKAVSIIFKTEIQDLEFPHLKAKYPQEIKVLDGQAVIPMSDRTDHDQKLLTEEFFISLEEEDKMFADKRESPRARPTEEKWVKVAKLQSSGPNLFKLYDLSRGGLGFLTLSENDFTIGMEVHIVGFNEFDLDDPFIGEVKSVRPTSENFTEFKVGVKFSAGQD